MGDCTLYSQKTFLLQNFVHLLQVQGKDSDIEMMEKLGLLQTQLIKHLIATGKDISGETSVDDLFGLW